MTKDIRSSDKKILRDAHIFSDEIRRVMAYSNTLNTTNLTKDTSHSVIAISEYES